MAILVIAEHDNAGLKAATLNTVTAAAALGGEIHLLVASQACDGACAAAPARRREQGAVRRCGPLRRRWRREPAALVVSAVRDSGTAYTHLLGTGHHLRQERLAAGCRAARRGADPEIVAVESADTFVRPIYAGNALATVQSSDPIKVITVRTTAFDAAGEGGRRRSKRLPPARTWASRSWSGVSSPSRSGPSWARRRPSSRVAAALAAATTTAPSSSRWPTSSARRWERAVRRSMPASCPTTTRSGPDRQGGRPAAVPGGGHLRCDPASGRHEGFQGDRGDQQGSGSADLPGGRLRSGGRSVRDRPAADRRDLSPDSPCRRGSRRPSLFAREGARPVQPNQGVSR